MFHSSQLVTSYLFYSYGLCCLDISLITHRLDISLGEVSNIGCATYWLVFTSQTKNQTIWLSTAARFFIFFSVKDKGGVCPNIVQYTDTIPVQDV